MKVSDREIRSFAKYVDEAHPNRMSGANFKGALIVAKKMRDTDSVLAEFVYRCIEAQDADDYMLADSIDEEVAIHERKSFITAYELLIGYTTNQSST